MNPGSTSVPGVQPVAPVSSPTPDGVLGLAAELESWTFWWGFNKDLYLDLRAHLFAALPATNSDGFFLGQSSRVLGRDTRRPTDAEIRTRVVPALRRALAGETNKDVVTSALIALARIGEPLGEDGRSELEGAIAAFLDDANQEIRETATIALGILGHPTSITILGSLLADDPVGRELAGAREVPPRTRAFAAYGLGLIGGGASAEEDRHAVVRMLVEALGSDGARTSDVGVACVLALGLVPLEPLAATGEDDELDPAQSREGQLAFLTRFLARESNSALARAHCPRSLARLLTGLAGEAGLAERGRVRDELLALLARSARQPDAIVESVVLALGAIGTNGAEDEPIRAALKSALDSARTPQTRCFALIALAQVGGRTGESDSEAGIGAVAQTLLARLDKGQLLERAWAGLAIGVLGHEIAKRETPPPVLADLGAALRAAIEREREHSVVAAYAIGAGILGDAESAPLLLAKLDEVREDVSLGYIAVALGLLDRREAIPPIQSIVARSKYRPALLNQAAIGLGLLGDQDLVGVLVGMLAEAKGLATQAALASALGFIGDASSIEPLVALLEDRDKTDLARAFAAAALGLVADEDDLPWNVELAVDLNYRATTSTLVDPLGSGILDIL